MYSQAPCTSRYMPLRRSGFRHCAALDDRLLVVELGQGGGVARRRPRSSSACRRAARSPCPSACSSWPTRPWSTTTRARSARPHSAPQRARPRPCTGPQRQPRSRRWRRRARPRCAGARTGVLGLEREGGLDKVRESEVVPPTSHALKKLRFLSYSTLVGSGKQDFEPPSERARANYLSIRNSWSSMMKPRLEYETTKAFRAPSFAGGIRERPGL